MNVDPKVVAQDLLDKRWPLLALVNVATFVTLTTLFFKNANEVLAGDEDGDGDGNNRNQWRNEDGEWDVHMDFKAEEAEGFGVVFVPFILIVASLSLIAPALKVWHPSTGSVSKIPVGMLTAAQFMFGQMLFISYWFLSDFQKEEEEDQGNDRRLEDNQDGNDQYDDGYYEMSEEELLAFRQKKTRDILLVFAFVHLIMSVYLLDWGRKLSSSAASTTSANVTGQASVFMEIWKFATKLSFLISCIQTLGIFACFFTEQGQRMLEEGGLITNAFVVALWTLLLTGITNFIGNRVMIKKVWTDAVGVGAFAGCQIGLGWTFFMVFFLYCFASVGARREGLPITGSLSACALFLWGVYSFMGNLTLKYSDSIAADISQVDGEASSDYQNMEDKQEQGSDSDYVKDLDEENGSAPKGEVC